MTILFILIPLTMMLLVLAVAAFFWAVNNNQFDDLDSPAYIVLLDDEPERIQTRVIKDKSATKTDENSSKTTDNT